MFNEIEFAAKGANSDGVCEQCGMETELRYGLCSTCEHPDDTEFYNYDPGAEF